MRAKFLHRGQHFSFPTAPVDAGLSNEQIGVMIRFITMDERGELPTVARLASEGQSAPEAVELALDRRIEVGFLTTTDPQPLPEVAPPPPIPSQYGPREWAGLSNEPGHRERVPTGLPVVHFQFDTYGRLAYVGSTDRFAKQMAEYTERRRSEVWATWIAKECPTRKIAYQLEMEEILNQEPYQKGGAMTVAITGRADPKWPNRCGGIERASRTAIALACPWRHLAGSASDECATHGEEHRIGQDLVRRNACRRTALHAPAEHCRRRRDEAVVQ